MGRITGQLRWDNKFFLANYFVFSFFSCIFASSDIRFGEYGHISAFIYTYSSI